MPETSRTQGRRRWPLGLAAVVVIAVVLAAWGVQDRYAGGVGSPEGGPSPPYSITVSKEGMKLKAYDLAALHALPQSRVVIDGKAQTGPSLAVVLADAGVGRYSSVFVRGAGLRDKGSLTLTRSQVRRRVQFDFSERGTVKVCGPALYHAEWVRDVLTVDAR
jgi:hypothetical protein